VQFTKVRWIATLSDYAGAVAFLIGVLALVVRAVWAFCNRNIAYLAGVFFASAAFDVGSVLIALANGTPHL